MKRAYALGYSTCGFDAARSMRACIDTLANLGYEGVELELDRGRFHPHVHPPALVSEIARACEDAKLRMVLGTGGRHVLTAERHHPGAVSTSSDDRGTWVSFVKDAVSMAGDMGAECVMVHSGYTPPGVADDVVWGWLVHSMAAITEHAAKVGQRIAVEWHPEMYLRDAAGYLRLQREVGARELGCTLDVGHAHCTETESSGDIIRRLAPHTMHVQLEDMKDRVHKHLRLGEGQLDFDEIFTAFTETGFAGVVALEFNAGDLGGDGTDLASSSIAFLRGLRTLATTKRGE